MAYAMTKQGSLDNCVTYKFICDTVADMNAIENRYRTLGSIAIVLQGNGGMEAYIAGSDKQWNNLGTMGANSSSNDSNSNSSSNLVVDATFGHKEGEGPYFITEMTAADIAAAYKSGSNIIIHFISSEDSARYSISSDTYLSMIGFAEAWDRGDGYSDTDGYLFVNNPTCYTQGGSRNQEMLTYNIIDEETGKLKFIVYYD